MAKRQRTDASRRSLFLWIAIAASAGALVAVAVSFSIKSPAQLAAEKSPPPASVVTTAATEQVLAAEVAVRATVRAGDKIGLAAPSVEGVVLTAHAPILGQTVSEGDVAVELSGEPVIALTGEIATFRTVEDKTTGEDVKQIQAALARLGYLRPSQVDGIFGDLTNSALTEMFKDRGYEFDLSKIRDQIFFVPRLPAVVAGVSTKLGRPVSADDDVFQLYVGDPQIEVLMQPAQGAESVNPGDRVTVNDDINGRSLTGSVLEIGPFTELTEADTDSGAPDTSTTAGRKRSGFPLRIQFDEPMDSSWIGIDARVVVTLAESDGPSLVVPQAALFSGADGQTRLSVVRAGQSHEVAVSVGLETAGLAAVVPLVSTDLAAGDEVVIQGGGG